MATNLRSLFPYVAATLALAALAYAVTFGTLPPADFTFINGTEVQSIDSGKVSGVPEHRIIEALFEGLFRNDPETLQPIPGVAERHEISADGKTYTFELRENAIWSDGTPVTAEDFWWSWRRVLHPETAGEYAYQLYYLKNAEKYNSALVEVGDRVEVELDDRPDEIETFPRGTILLGKLLAIDQPPEPTFAAGIDKEAKKNALGKWKQKWTYTVEIDGQPRRFRKSVEPGEEKITKCKYVLLDFAEVGVRVLGPRKLQATLNNSTPFFLHLMAFYTTYPVNRACIERHGRHWTKAENLVNNGAYRLGFRRIRDRIRLVKNPEYWDAENVQLEVIDALAVNSTTTTLNMYMNGEVDWAMPVPLSVVPEVRAEYPEEFHSKPILATYFYRMNTLRPPLDDVRVRRALNMTINKREICELLLQAGQLPATSVVPPGMVGYEQPQGAAFDPEAARQLLADAGFAGGRGMRKLEILFNDGEAHKTIAEKIQSDWRTHLGVETQLRNLEWGVYLDTINQMKYDVARYAWVGDYPDPNTYIDMFVKDGTNNRTGWTDPKYDALVAAAASESNAERRLEILHDAEQILLDAQPVAPIYFYVSLNLVRPYVRGFHDNIQDIHPLSALRIDPRERAEYWKGQKRP